MSRLLHDLLDDQRRRSPTRPAVRRGDLVLTYDELWRRSRAYAGWLSARGVRRGDRVLVFAPHDAETVAAIFAISRLGAVYVVASDRLPAARLVDVVADAQPRLLLTSDRSAIIAAPTGPGTDGHGRSPESAGGEPAGTRAAAGVAELARVTGVDVARLEDLPTGGNDLPTGDDLAGVDDGVAGDRAEAGDEVPESGAIGLDPVGLLYTSGSTSTPKAVVSTHRQVLFVTGAIGARLRYRPDDVVLCCMPLSFDYGLYQVFLCVQAGAELVLGDDADAGPRLVSRLTAWRVTVFPLVPTLAVALATLVARAGRPPATLRMITSSGAALPPATADRLRALVPGLDVVSMFGLTECKRVSIMEPNADIDRPGAVGRPLPGTEVFVVDEQGRPLPPGAVGELVVRGEHVMSGYWRAPELSAAKFRRDEFGAPLLFTGDRCRLDGDGYLYFVGRDDDLYKQRGFRVSAVEVEAAAQRLPAVHLAAVIPPRDGAATVLVVAPVEGA
ncbi:MAG: class I adenylate-forming enzyme family protein, partial [Frankia sp.]